MTNDTVTELFELFREKDRDKNNPKSGWDMNAILCHAHSEISEVWDAIRKNEPRVRVLEEVSDVMNLAIVIAVRLDITPEQLFEECKRKFERMAQLEKERAYV